MSQNLPQHIAVIPDGNRRWARKRGLFPWQGHLAGVRALEKILEAVRDLKIPYFTFWAGSYDNLIKRPTRETNFLYGLYSKYFLKLAKDKRIHKDKIKINVFGRWQEVVPKKAKEAIEKSIQLTKDYNNYFLTVLVAYNGVDEVVEAMKNIAKSKNAEITADLIKENLWTADLPPVDLLIRTGGEPHNSTGFMMWHTANTQLYFTKTLWPDFDKKEFQKAIEEYGERGRRFGV